MCNEYLVDGTIFLARVDKRTDTVSVSSCHPYDEQNYHWARRSERTGNWLVFRNGTVISCQSKYMSEEEIAKHLNNLDRPLKPMMCYN